uniref:L-dopachrome isomerase n=1 Tax=Strongyloides ratti TaxID=34506 RepID=B5TWC5_STRRB|nr:macrophage migration inhibitory factor [Strongyloides ratti]
MPYVRLFSNLPETSFTDAFCTEFTDLLAEKLGKDKSRIVMLVQPHTIMSSGGVPGQPSIWIEINNVGQLSPRQTQELSRDLTHFVMEKTTIPRESISILYFDMSPDMVARGGITIAESIAGLK